MTVEEVSEKLYGSLRGLVSDYINLLETIKDFDKKWDIQGFPNDADSSVKDMESELEMLKPQIMRIKKKCVVFGKTSAGKSTFINALLTEKILPTCFGSTTNVFCKVKPSLNNNIYFEIQGSSQKYKVDEISKINEENATNKIAERKSLKLFYDRERCELLNEDVVIIDTPGMDAHIDLNEKVEKVCKEADVIILFVNAMGTLNLSDMAVLSKYKTIFSNITVFFVYTLWDVVHKKDKSGSIKQQHIENAKKFLCNEFGYSKDMALKNIYFLSAKERLKMFSKKSAKKSVIDDELYKKRKEDFDLFFSILKNKLSENAYVRIRNYLESSYQKLSRLLRNSEVSSKKILLKSDELSQKIQLNFQNKDQHNGEINAQISKIFTSAFEEFIIIAIDDMKIQKDKNKNNKYSQICENEVLTNLFNNIIKDSLTKTKENILGLFPNEAKESNPICREILEKYYFPNYLDLTDQMNSFDMDCIEQNLLIITKKLLRTKIIAGVTTALLGLVGLGTGGIGLAVAGAVPAGLAVGAGGVAAGAAAGGTSVGIVTAVKKKIYFSSTDCINNMKVEWNKMESPLLDSFSRFMNNLPMFSPIQAEFRNMEKRLNAWKEETDHFLNPSHLQ